jgi:D-lyxose ketol-isomerase
MKRSVINTAIESARKCFGKNGWFLPPNPKWDITDFGLGSFAESGLVLVNLAEEAEYCEKVMYVMKNQLTPTHTHKKKKEDINRTRINKKKETKTIFFLTHLRKINL